MRRDSIYVPLKVHRIYVTLIAVVFIIIIIIIIIITLQFCRFRKGTHTRRTEKLSIANRLQSIMVSGREV
jgi:heme/copper-type cytochrome/quinol oxidase subunit 2